MYLLTLSSTRFLYSFRLRTLPVQLNLFSSHTTVSVHSKDEKELKDAADFALDKVFKWQRPHTLKRWRSNLSTWYNLMKYQLFYDRQFRMKPFRDKARFALYYTAEQVYRKNYKELTDLFTPEALNELKKTLENDKESKTFCSSLTLGDTPIYCENIFEAKFVSTKTDAPVFEIALAYLCGLDSKLVDRKKERTLFKGNRVGGQDEIRGRIREQDLIYIVAWLTLVKPGAKDENSDWRIQRFDPMVFIVPVKSIR